MIYIIIIIIFSIDFILIKKIISRKNNKKSSMEYSKLFDTEKNEIAIYSQRNLMTPTETKFYFIMKELESELGVRIHPQVNLCTIIVKNNNDRYRNELFRNIDFGIFTDDYETLLILIEINDSSHGTYERQKRDKKVRDICKQAKVEIINFYTNMPNEKEYVKNRIKEKIGMQSR